MKKISLILSLILLVVFANYTAARSRGGSSFRTSSFSFKSTSKSSSRSKQSSGFSLFGSDTKSKSTTKTASSKQKSGISLKDKKATTTSKQKSGISLKDKKSNKSKTTFGSSVQKKESKKNFNDNYLSKFKKQPAKSTTTSSKLGSGRTSTTKPKYTSSERSYINDSMKYDRSTYYNRRNSYYSDYNPPVYMYNSSPSFGMWDSMALWYMLDHANDRNQYQLAYNQQNDAGYQEWRREADRLAADNDDLRRKLNQLDANANAMTGTIDPNYVPKGMDKDLMLSSATIEGNKPTLNVCTGNPTGYYRQYGNKLKEKVAQSFNINAVITKGSVDNLTKLDSGECDAALTQRDAYDLYEICSNDTTPEVVEACKLAGLTTGKTTKMNFTKIATPFNDTVLALCSSEFLFSAKSISLVKGGGDLITWIKFTEVFPYLNDVDVTLTKSLAESVDNVNKEVTECTLAVINGQGNTKKITNSKVKLAPINKDNEILTLKDPLGDKLYKTTLLTDSYKALHKDNNWGTDDTTTINVKVDLLVANTWKLKYPAHYKVLHSYVN